MKTNPDIVIAYWRAAGIPEPITEYKFAIMLGRKWRMDYAWPERKLALEVQGGIFIQGRHSRGAALLKEWEKLNTAAGIGWRFLYCQPSDLLKQPLVDQIKKALH